MIPAARLCLLLFIFCWTGLRSATAQCLTDFTKLLPEPALDYAQGFGSALAMYDDYLAVGIANHDSLGRLAGLVYIYQKLPVGWSHVATLAPSDPADGLRFGATLGISQNYLAVGASGYGGRVYLFKKTSGGWTNQTEIATFAVTGTSYFGSLGSQTIEISPDEQTIAIADYYLVTGESPNKQHGAVFIYHKQVHEEWDGAETPLKLLPPEETAVDFGRGGVEIMGDRIAVAMPYGPNGNGMIYLYQDITGQFSNVTLEARLSSGTQEQSIFSGYTNFIFTDDGIFSSSQLINPPLGRTVHFFEKPGSGNWVDATPTCHLYTFTDDNLYPYIKLSESEDGILASIQSRDGGGTLRLIRKGAGGWCHAQTELIDSYMPEPDQYVFDYGDIMTSSQVPFAAIGMLPHPESLQAQLAIRVLAKLPDNTWEKQLIYTSDKSTAGHRYGARMVTRGEHLFVSASNDATVKEYGGAVYSYRKVGNAWQQTGKILPRIDGAYDDVFGSALALSDNFLAIGALGFEPSGRVFLYKKKNSNWSDPELWQEIDLAADSLDVSASGDHLAMNGEWLLIPYVQSNPFRTVLAIYRYNGDKWEFHQRVVAGLANLFAKSASLAVDIEENIIIIGTNLLEWEAATDQWVPKHILTPSDPEAMRMSPDFTHWVTNGATFGHDVDIDGNTIFISAPTKDHEGKQDVGAVYVYTKKPWENWSSRTESAKLLPRVVEERELFGYSIKAFENTLIVGAPGSDYNLNGTGRNLPGRAYVFQSSDYFWQDATPLVDFTGDTFKKDYFGLDVTLDESDFVISASIEDTNTGQLSGSVYVTPAPPMVRLVPPICNENTPVQLLGYPFNGTWSGPGIVDAERGIFDPAVAGPGSHYLAYATESCANKGLLKVHVESPPTAAISGDDVFLTCEENPVSVSLQGNSEEGNTYRWYYRETEEAPFHRYEQLGTSVLATKVGEYQLRVNNEACQAFSEVVSVRYQHVPLVLDSLARICTDEAESIELTATPEGGRWSGPGVVANRLFTKNIDDGLHALRYMYVSDLGCKFADTVSLLLERLPVPIISRGDGHLCEEGEVTLQLNGGVQGGLLYQWRHRAEGAADFTDVEGEGTLTAVARGAYKLYHTDGECAVDSNILNISDSTFKFTFTPAAPVIDLCYGQAAELAFTGASHHRYSWYFAETPEEDPEQLSTTTSKLTADKSGSYYATVESGICKVDMPRKQVFIQPKDSLWVPNVFSPNGDGYNETFEVFTNQEQAVLTVYNRNGENIFTGKATRGWTGDGALPAVYFWNVSYTSCEGDKKVLRGTVQLMR